MRFSAGWPVPQGGPDFFNAQWRLPRALAHGIGEQRDPGVAQPVTQQGQQRRAKHGCQPHLEIERGRDLLVDQEAQQRHQGQVEEAGDRGGGVLDGIAGDGLARHAPRDARVVAQILEQMDDRIAGDDQQG